MTIHFPKENAKNLVSQIVNVKFESDQCTMSAVDEVLSA